MTSDPEPRPQPPGFWRRWWWVIPLYFGGAGVYQLLTGIDSGRWGPPVIGVPMCFIAGAVGAFFARTGRLDRT